MIFKQTPEVFNLLVQLSIFLIDLFVGTYRLSSHARLEAFVIQTKLKLTGELLYILKEHCSAVLPQSVRLHLYRHHNTAKP
jgi:hypothetical protein